MQRKARALGLGVAGYYHCHPDDSARPSETDRRLATEGNSDGVVHVVVAVDRGPRTEATAWLFHDARQGFEPLKLSVEEEAWP